MIVKENTSRAVVRILKSRVVPLLKERGIENASQLITFTDRCLGYENRITNHVAYAIWRGDTPTVAQASKLMSAFDISMDQVYEFVEP